MENQDPLLSMAPIDLATERRISMLEDRLKTTEQTLLNQIALLQQENRRLSMTVLGSTFS
jgi:hypothetical protein